MSQKVAAIVVVGMLAWALIPSNPYGYYQVLKVFVSVYSAFLATTFLKQDTDSLCGWLALSFAILYNPIFPLHLGRPVWSITNILTALFILHLAFITPKQKP